MIKLCIFDMDGTTVNSINSISHFANGALKKFGYAAIPTERYKRLVGNGADILVRRMLNEVGGRDSDYEGVRCEYNKTYDDGFLYLAEPYEGIVDMLRELKRRGIKIAILSNKPDSTTGKISEALFGDSLIDLCCGAREGVKLKPDPSGVFEIMRHFSVAKDECLYIGDTATDMETAKNAGLYSVGVLWGFRDRAELEAADAAEIIAEPHELIGIIDKIEGR